MTLGAGGAGAPRRRELGAMLRAIRIRAELAIEDVADHLDRPAPHVVRIEEGTAGLRFADARQLLDTYGVTGDEREQVLRVTREIGANNWWFPYSDLVGERLESLLVLEDEASAISTHQPHLVPGLLQTYRYGWELMTTLGDQPLERAERRMRLRSARQRVLTRDSPPRLAVVLGEAALRRPVGGPDVMRGQYDRLIAVATMPTTTLWVVPLHAGPHRAVGSVFHIFAFDQDGSRVLQVELLDRERLTCDAEEIRLHATAFEEASRQALDTERSLELLRELAAQA
jgi:transcriptional regulator with XRE-family HTH domain